VTTTQLFVIFVPKANTKTKRVKDRVSRAFPESMAERTPKNVTHVTTAK
jgi:hypothetical protein